MPHLLRKNPFESTSNKINFMQGDRSSYVESHATFVKRKIHLRVFQGKSNST